MGTQRHHGEDLPRDPSAQGREQVAHGVLQENSLGHNPRTDRKLRNLIEKSKSRRPGATKRLVAQRDEPACTRAGSAVLVPFKRVLPLAVAAVSRAASLCTCDVCALTCCGLGVRVFVGLSCVLRGCIALEFGLVSLGLHCFLRLSHALYCRSTRCLAYVAFPV